MIIYLYKEGDSFIHRWTQIFTAYFLLLIRVNLKHILTCNSFFKVHNAILKASEQHWH